MGDGYGVIRRGGEGLEEIDADAGFHGGGEEDLAEELGIHRAAATEGEQEAAGLDPSHRYPPADRGYVIGVFGDPDDPQRTVLTVWLKIAVTSPYLRTRWTYGLHVPTGASDAEMDKTVWQHGGTAHGYYRSHNGHAVVGSPWRMVDYWTEMRMPKVERFVLNGEPAAEPPAPSWRRTVS